MSKKLFKNPRKTVAIALVGLGLAGVSVASAATLTLNGNDATAVQAGTASVDGVCQESEIIISFSLDGNDVGALEHGDDDFGYPSANDVIVLTAIDEDCAGKNIKVALGDEDNIRLGQEYGPMAAAAGPLSLSLAAGGAFGAAAIDAADVAQVAVTIFD